MKHLPDQPPEPVPGRVAQGGAAGPFVRGGRLPVDRRGSAACARRAGFSQGPKQYRFGDGTFRSDWNAAGAPGAGGVQRIAGATVLASMSAAALPPPPPTGAPAGFPNVTAATVAAPATLLFTLAAPPDPSWLIFTRLSRAELGGYTSPRVFTAFVLSWQGGQVVSDFWPLYAAYFGPLVAGYSLTTNNRLQADGAWGAIILQQFWDVPSSFP